VYDREGNEITFGEPINNWGDYTVTAMHVLHSKLYLASSDGKVYVYSITSGYSLDYMESSCSLPAPATLIRYINIKGF
jgi:hypothetical protein